MTHLRAVRADEVPSQWEHEELLLRPVFRFDSYVRPMRARELGCKRAVPARRYGRPPSVRIAMRMYGPIQEHAPPSPLLEWKPALIYAPRAQRPGARPKLLNHRGLSDVERQQLEDAESELRMLGILPLAPADPGGACVDEEGPCPRVSCRANLYLDILPSEFRWEPPRIKLNFPGKEIDELEETCTYRVARRGPLLLEEVGRLINLTQEGVRKVEVIALDKVKSAFGPSNEKVSDPE